MPGGLFCPIGNPARDGTWTYTWEKGRQLKSISKSGTTANFKYNENGLRIQKTVNGAVTNYTLHGKNIHHMTQGSNSLHFFYDASNKPAIVDFNGTKYAYVHNLQGDIVAILDSNGSIVVQYKYDAWGKPISKTGSMASTLGTVQPFRYRGYVYDDETGLYYLRSRYYQSRWGRFLKCDITLGTVGAIFSSNLWMYCDNNTINGIDRDGLEMNLVQPFVMTHALGTKDTGGGGGGLVIAGVTFLSKIWSKVVGVWGQLTTLLFPAAAYVSELADVGEVSDSTEQAQNTPRPETGIYWVAYTVGDGMPIIVGNPMTFEEAVRLIDKGKVVATICSVLGKKGYKPYAYGFYTPNRVDACRLADRFTNTRVDEEIDNPSHLPHFHCATDKKLHFWFSR